MIGHTLGAAGAIESIACVLMLTGGFVHPSGRYEVRGSARDTLNSNRANGDRWVAVKLSRRAALAATMVM